LAVLPLENLSGDPAQEYFSDGMTDELITELGQIADLRVIAEEPRYNKLGRRHAAENLVQDFLFAWLSSSSRSRVSRAHRR
jgi:TolB-like protein